MLVFGEFFPVGFTIEQQPAFSFSDSRFSVENEKNELHTDSPCLKRYYYFKFCYLTQVQLVITKWLHS